MTRPVIINGIEDLTSRNDLADRSIVLFLPTIPDDKRKTAREIQTAFQESYPALLGSLYSAVSTALKNRDSVKLPTKPRMADFAVWITAAEEVLPVRRGQMLEAYETNRRRVSEFNVENDEVAGFMRSRSKWTGCITSLLRDLRAYFDEDTPGVVFMEPPRFRARLIRAIPALRGIGIDVEYDPKYKHPRTRRTLYTISNSTGSVGMKNVA